MSRFICLVLLLAATAAPALAQGLVRAEPGARVRILPAGDDRLIYGEVVRVGPDSISISTAAGPLALSRDSVTTLEVSQGKWTNSIRGLGKGALIGGGAGTLIGIVIWRATSGEWLESGPEAIPVGAAGGAVLGGLVGLGIGSIVRTERWQTVADGTRLGIAASF